ncbi:hypothetical protein ACM26V_03590 [Salipaludibacillus sp. HK11]|uniref:hypothetical protein n=1 Tax=Salipaludibacillus sp. HK11 TaxID=3394320 RepID=UPI0039FD3AFE
MMLLAPFLTAFILGIIILMLTYWFSKKGFSLFIRMLPGIIAIIGAVILFYIGFVDIRGFEGGTLGLLGFLIAIFSIIAFVIGKNDKTVTW